MKKLFTLIALLATVVSGAWAYELPTGYVIKSVFLGTDNGDGTVTPEDFEEASSLGTEWSKGPLFNSIGIVNVSEVALPEVNANASVMPTYVSGKTMQGYLRQGGGNGLAYATYTMSSKVENGTLVFSGDFCATSYLKNAIYFRLCDEDGNPVLTLQNNATNDAATKFKYAIGTNAEVETTANSTWRTYNSFRIIDLTINLETGATSFTLDYINNSGVRKQLNVTGLNVGVGKNIKSIQLGRNCVSSTNVYTHMDNLSLYHVGSATSQYVDYTIKFRDTNGNEIKGDAVYNTGVVGNNITATEGDMATFYSSDGLKKYVYKTGNEEKAAVADAASNVITLVFNTYDKYNYSACAVDGSNNIIKDNIASGYVYTDANATYFIPAAVLNGNTLSMLGGENHKKDVTITADNQKDRYAYTNRAIENVCFYTEAEDLAGTSTSNPNENLKYLASNGKMGRGSNITVTTLPAGMYRITCKYINTNNDGHSVAFVAGETEIYSNTNVTVRPTLTTGIFVLDDEATIKFTAAGTSTSGIDYIYIEKLPATVPVTIGADGYATFVAPYPVDFTDNEIEAYVVSAVDATTATLTKVTAVPAGEAVIVKGATGTVNVVASAAAITNKMEVATAAIAYSEEAENINYVLAKYEGNVGLYPVNSGTIAKGKGYLPVAKPATEAKGGLKMVFGGVTAADAIEAEAETVKAGKYATPNGIVIVKNGVKYNVAGMMK